MKVLLDTCVAGSVKAELAAVGHDVVWMGDLEEDPGDEEILAQAQREGRILVTLDKDFGELVIVRRRPHHGVLRLVNLSSRQQATVAAQILNKHGADLQAGSFITAELGRLRIRPPDPPDPP